MKPVGGAIAARGAGHRTGARAVALDVLVGVHRQDVPADERLDAGLARAGLDQRDRALAHELVYGVLRHRASLDWRLGLVADRPVERLPLVVRGALWLGAYQLLHLDRVPASAAVDESVDLVKRLPGGHWAGFVNAVLRRLAREPAPPWPSLETDPLRSLSLRYSCPSWLAARWLARYGPAKAEAACRATTVAPPLTIRANRLKTTREALAEALTAEGCVVRPTAYSPDGLLVEKRGAVTDLPQFEQGLFYVEDEAAQLVARLLDPRPGELVLDACAAPGGKATHLAAMMRDRGEIVALDRSDARLARLRENCRRLGIHIVRPLAADAAAERHDHPALARAFDRVLVDAPCSGLGVLRRHPEGKWRKGEADLAAHHAAQARLLDGAARRLRPGGVLVYSTCSPEPEENEQVIDEFCDRHPEFQRESVEPWLPPGGSGLVTVRGDLSTQFSPDAAMDAFFAARLRKVAPA